MLIAAASLEIKRENLNSNFDLLLPLGRLKSVILSDAIKMIPMKGDPWMAPTRRLSLLQIKAG